MVEKEWGKILRHKKKIKLMDTDWGWGEETERKNKEKKKTVRKTQDTKKKRREIVMNRLIGKRGKRE